MEVLDKQLKMTAQEANVHGYFFRINGQNCKIMTYRGKESHPVIPAYINGKPVRAIGRKAFAGSDIKGVTLPDTIRVIGDMAFFDTSIERLELPGDILKIEQRAFRFCRNLKEVILKPQIERKQRVDVNQSAFEETPYIEKDMFVILDRILLKANISASEINFQCPEKVIRIPASVEVIGEEAILYGHHFVIPSSVKLIRKHGFQFANTIESIVLEHRTSDLILRKWAFGFCWNINYNYVSFFRKLLINSLMPGSRKRIPGWKHFCKLHLWANYESWGEDADAALLLALWRFKPIECKIYFPESVPVYSWLDMLDISIHNNEFCVSLSMDEYFELMMQVPKMSDKVEMAICILTNAFTKKYQTKALGFLKLHINKAVTLAVKNGNTYNIKFFQQYDLLKEGAGFRIKTYKCLKKKYFNAAFVLLEHIVKRYPD